MSSAGMELDPIEQPRFLPEEEVESAFYLHLEVEDRPGVLAQVAQILGVQEVSVKSVVQKGLGENARLVMVMHPVPSAGSAARSTPSRSSTSCARGRGPSG